MTNPLAEIRRLEAKHDELKEYVLRTLRDGLVAGKQPLDSDLTAIAALTTTAFGLAFLEFANEAAFKAGVNLEIGTDVQAYSARRCLITTGTYTGDGSTSQSITGVGFQPKYVRIWKRETADGNDVRLYETTDTIVDDDAGGMCFWIASVSVSAEVAHSRDDRIAALGSDGFTVDDGTGDFDPNKNGETYNYLALGAG